MTNSLATTKQKNGAAVQYRVRITGYGVANVDELLANPLNWRVHPGEQRDLLDTVMRDYGVVQNIIVNTRTGHVVDGHLRVKIAMQKGVPTLPVTYIDISEQEEKAILAAFDTIGSMAVRDDDMYGVLLADIATFDVPLAKSLASVDVTNIPGVGSDREPEPPADDDLYDVVVSLDDGRAQSTFVREMKRRGIRCRTVRQ